MFISNEHKHAAGIITLQFIPLFVTCWGISVLQTWNTSSLSAEHNKNTIVYITAILVHKTNYTIKLLK